MKTPPRPPLADSSPAGQLTRHLIRIGHLWLATMALLLIYATWKA